MTHKAIFTFEKACSGFKIIVSNLVYKAIHNDFIAFCRIVIITLSIVIRSIFIRSEAIDRTYNVTVI